MFSIKESPKETPLKKYIGLFAKGIGLGLGLGLCLAGLAGILLRAVHSGEAGFQPGRADLYFFVVGAFMGIIGGWCLSLQMILDNLLTALFLKILELVPLPAAPLPVVGEEWARKMETLFHEILQPMPGLFRRLVEAFLVPRLADYGRINRALDKARKKGPPPASTAQWMSLAVLHYFLEPLWLFFYAAYAILLFVSCVFWSFPFFK